MQLYIHQIKQQELIGQKAEFWKKVLERLFTITLTLSRRMLPFRGNKKNSSHNGNFLSLVHFVSKYDPLLQKVLEKPKGTQ